MKAGKTRSQCHDPTATAVMARTAAPLKETKRAERTTQPFCHSDGRAYSAYTAADFVHLLLGCAWPTCLNLILRLPQDVTHPPDGRTKNNAACYSSVLNRDDVTLAREEITVATECMQLAQAGQPTQASSILLIAHRCRYEPIHNGGLKDYCVFNTNGYAFTFINRVKLFKPIV